MLDAHVHIERGPYTLAWIREFVDQAVRMGLDRLCLLEHSHNFVEFASIYRRVDTESPVIGRYQREWLARKMTGHLGEYAALAREIRKACWPLEIRWGLEVCYFPGAEEVTAAIVSAHDWDFLTGAVHWIDGWGFDHPATRESWRGKDVDAVHVRYYEIMKSLIESGLFTHLAHPESIKCFGHRPRMDMKEIYRGIAAAAARCRVKVEFNNGLRINYGLDEPGLSDGFLACLRQEGVEILTASDAHRPADVGRYVRETEALMAGGSGL